MKKRSPPRASTRWESGPSAGCCLLQYAIPSIISTLIVLLLFLPLMFGINGVLYAGPVADVLAAVVSFFVLRREFRRVWREAETPDP